MCAENWLLNIVESGYYTVKDWQNWADNVIMNSEIPDCWICEVSLAKDSGEVKGIIFSEFVHINEDWDIILGYRYMMYREGRITLYHLIDELADEDNMIVEYCDLPYKRIFEMYWLVTENDWLDDIEIKEISSELCEILQPYFEKAVNQKNQLESYMNGGKKE